MNENVVPLLSLLVTVLGWLYTAIQQRKILERQINAEKDKERDKLYLSQTISEVDSVKKWVNEGYSICNLCKHTLNESDKEDLKTRFKIWYYTEGIDNIVYSLDRKAKKENFRFPKDQLSEWTWAFSHYVIYTATNTLGMDNIYYDGHARDYDDSGLHALDRLDIITRETLGLPIDLKSYLL